MVHFRVITPGRRRPINQTSKHEVVITRCGIRGIVTRYPFCWVCVTFFLGKHVTYLGKRVMYLGSFSAHGFCQWFSISG
jgi:hypothetical protein